MLLLIISNFPSSSVLHLYSNTSYVAINLGKQYLAEFIMENSNTSYVAINRHSFPKNGDTKTNSNTSYVAINPP